MVTLSGLRLKSEVKERQRQIKILKATKSRLYGSQREKKEEMEKEDKNCTGRLLKAKEGKIYAARF